MRKMLRTTVVLAALVASATLSGCTGAQKTVDYTDTSVSLSPGETLVVDFGFINPSIGDEWIITAQPDATVLEEGRSSFDSGQPDPPPGSGGELVYRFAPVGSGTTTISFEYRYRGEIPEDPDDQKTAEITVTVK